MKISVINLSNNMKNFVKWLGIIVFVAAIGFLMVSFGFFCDDDERLNGDWDRAGQYVVTFNGCKGIFKELYGGIWLDGKNAGQINVGEQCLRNIIKKSDNKWTGKIRIYNINSPHETLRWENCSITLNVNTQTVQVSYNSATFSLTKK